MNPIRSHLASSEPNFFLLSLTQHLMSLGQHQIHAPRCWLNDIPSSSFSNFDKCVMFAIPNFHIKNRPCIGLRWQRLLGLLGDNMAMHQLAISLQIWYWMNKIVRTLVLSCVWAWNGVFNFVRTMVVALKSKWQIKLAFGESKHLF